MMKNMMERYVILNPEYKLIESPGFGVIYKKKESVALDKIIFRVKENNTSVWINSDALKILELCDGKRRIKDIIEMIVSEENCNKSEIEKIKEFLFLAYRNEHILIDDLPIKKGMEIGGSKEFYMPLHLSIELTDSCNLNCAHCYRSKASNYIDPDKLDIFIRKMSKETLMGVELTGGEPILHPDFIDIVECCVKNLNIVGVLTNGTLLTEKMIEKLSAYRDSLFFGISLDSHDPEYHDKFRGMRGAWEKTVRNIERLINKGFLVRVGMSVNQENMYHIEPLLEFCMRIGVKAFTYSPIMPFGNAKSFRWEIEDLKKLAEIEKRVHKKYGKVIPIVKEHSSSSEGLYPNNCGAGWKTFVMDPRGYIRPCVVSDSRHNIGRIDFENPRKFFEKNKEISNIYANLLLPGKGVCDNCRYINFCSMCILRAEKVLNEGLIDPGDCKWFKKIGKEKLDKIGGIIHGD